MVIGFCVPNKVESGNLGLGRRTSHAATEVGSAPVAAAGAAARTNALLPLPSFLIPLSCRAIMVSSDCPETRSSVSRPNNSKYTEIFVSYNFFYNGAILLLYITKLR